MSGRVGAGIFGVIWVLIVADLTRGTGHYSVTLRLVNAAHMIGFFFSQVTAGFVVDATQTYSGGFLWLSAVATAALLLFYFGLPETLDREAAMKNNARGPRRPERQSS